MLKFYRAIDKRSRKAMVDFLKEHFRYSTMNSWNRSNSYAHNMKIHCLGLDSETQNKLYALIQCRGFYDLIDDLMRDFGSEHGWLWQARFNGRCGGYLVLYQGERKPSGYKSYCPSCHQLNWTSISENSGKCGVCSHDRRDFTTPHMTTNDMLQF